MDYSKHGWLNDKKGKLILKIFHPLLNYVMEPLSSSVSFFSMLSTCHIIYVEIVRDIVRQIARKINLYSTWYIQKRILHISKRLVVECGHRTKWWGTWPCTWHIFSYFLRTPAILSPRTRNRLIQFQNEYTEVVNCILFMYWADYQKYTKCLPPPGFEHYYSSILLWPVSRRFQFRFVSLSFNILFLQ